MFIRLTHLTRYDYSQAVSFAPHALYLRPRETSRQRLHSFSLEITPAARRVATNDAHDNALDWAFFAAESPASRLEFRSELLVETLDENPFDFFLRPDAVMFPFVYDKPDRVALASCLAPRHDTPAPAVLRDWLTRHLPAPPSETITFLTALNSAVHRALTYAPREAPGIQSAAETMACRGGSCRDFAAFLVELCRMLGLAARFVSGYLYEPPAPNAAGTASQAMHAWAEIYLPGAGWRGLDPTRGIFCDDAFVPVAHAAIAESVNPIQGTFYGAPNVTSQLTTSLKVEKV
jgi:transglutaminase-like putative cysteine protease